MTRLGADPRFKAFWRFIRCWVTHNHKFWYTWVIICAFGVFNFWETVLIGYYRNRNYERSMGYAQMMEAEWEKNKPPEEEDDDDDEEDE